MIGPAADVLISRLAEDDLTCLKAAKCLEYAQKLAVSVWEENQDQRGAQKPHP